MRKRLAITVAVAVVCGTTPAFGDGGPGPGVVQGQDGIARGDVRYVAIPTGTETVLESINRRSGRVLRWMFVDGNYGIPQVAFDGKADGLSHDGRTLVLGDVSGGPVLTERSSFAVIDVRRFRLRAVVKLRGDFTFDALSPRGRMLYLVEHLSTSELAKYRVRAYDLGAGRLLSRVLSDKRSRVSVMQGLPLARASSSDGRWAYTLYAGGQHPFVHALDTKSAGAVCIDLPHAWRQLDTSGLRLRLDSDGTLVVRHYSGGNPLAVIDVKRFRVLSAVRKP